MSDFELINNEFYGTINYNTLRTKLFRQWYGTECGVQYYSFESQDRFAHKLIGNQGYFLDIGCGEPILHNNTYALEKLGWDGLLLDKSDFNCRHERSSKFFRVDVVSNAFVDILSKEIPVQVIDYISIDVDEFSVIALEQILSLSKLFKVITFEHDFYMVKEERRAPSRKLLKNAGYFLLFEDVLGLRTNGQPWEDWWIHPEFFPQNILNKRSRRLWHYECIKKL